MADFFKEILTDIDKLSDEQVNQLMAALEVKRAGGQTTKDSIKENDEIPLACPHQSEETRKSGRQTEIPLQGLL